MIAFHRNRKKGHKQGACLKSLKLFKTSMGVAHSLAIFVFVALSSFAYVDLEVTYLD